jgi:tetratricopeptide (TPR) repeat protein
MSDTLTPNDLLIKANHAYKKGDYLSAARLFESSAQAFSEEGNEVQAAETNNNACVAYLQIDENEKALSIVENTIEILEASEDPIKAAMAWGNLGSALEANDHFEEAEEAYTKSAELLRQTGEDQLRANVLQSLSALQLNKGRQLEALATMKAGVDGIKRPNLKQRTLKQLLEMPFKFINKS